MVNKFHNSPVKRKGVYYRSKLEDYCAKYLKLKGIPFKYEQISFDLIPKVEYPSWERVGKQFKEVNSTRAIRYIPDFVGDSWIIETKGVKTDGFKIKWKLFKQLLWEQGLNYDLYMPSNQKEVNFVVEHILNKH